MASIAGAPSPNTTRSRLLDELGALFRRIAVFRLEGTQAHLSECVGIPHPAGTLAISLVDRTPLRSAIEAASPIIGSGRDSGGMTLSRALGIGPARTFAIIPIVEDRRVVALAYADRIDEPLSLSRTAELFQFCSANVATRRKPIRQPRSTRAKRRTFSAPRAVCLRPALLPPPPPAEALAELEAPLEHESTAPEPATAEHPPPLPVEEPEADPIQSLLDPDEPLGEAWSLAYATAAALPEWSEDANATVLPPPRPVLVNSDGVSEAIPEGAEVRPARRWLLPVLSAALTLLIGLPSLALLSLAPPSDEATDAIVRIPEGESLGSIAARLHDAGTLRSPLAFKLVAIATGIDRTLKAGTYRLPQNVFGWEIASELSRGQINLRQLTIPEGLTLDEIASLIAEAGLASRSGFVEAARDRALLRELGIAGPSAEGYLYPETYRLAKGLSPHDIVRIMVEQFETVRRELGVEAHRLPLHDWVTLASIVEREVVAPKEMAKVAGVFRNRLQREMRLESCATVQYILGEPKAKLTLDDVRIPSPYNTYLHEGLPPGPIASPGIDALRAAAFPETHEYLFFVAREDGSGTHVFSKSYTEHRRAQTQIQK